MSVKRPFLGTESVNCRLCRKEFAAISPSHLKYRHGWRQPHPIHDYLKRFGLPSATSDPTRRRIRKARIFHYVRVDRHWTKPRVVDSILDLKRKGEPLTTPHGAGLRMQVYQAARRLFRSWRAALAAAGLDPSRILVRPPWSRKEVQATLGRLHRAGELHDFPRLRARYPSLMTAAIRLFGSWYQARVAAGAPPSRRAPTRWTKALVHQRIRERIRKGLPLIATALIREDSGLFHAGKRIFRTGWAGIAERLGYAYQGRRVWTRPRIVREIRRLRSRGKRLIRTAVEREDSGFVMSAIRRFGSWPAALEAAGIRTRL